MGQCGWWFHILFLSWIVAVHDQFWCIWNNELTNEMQCGTAWWYTSPGCFGFRSTRQVKRIQVWSSMDQDENWLNLFDFQTLPKNEATQIMPHHVRQIKRTITIVHNNRQMDLKQQKAPSSSSLFQPPVFIFFTHADTCMYVYCVADIRHTYPRLERKPAAVPEWDGKCYIIRVPDPAVHSLVPEPYLLWPGLAGVLQGWSTRFQWFVSPWLILFSEIFPFDWSFAVYTTFRFT